MIELGLSLQTAVRSALIANAGVTAHVHPDRIRAKFHPARAPAVYCPVTGSCRAARSCCGRAGGGRSGADVEPVVTIREDKPSANLIRTVRWMLGEEGEAA
ncbi:hypothetical protein [Paenirhodobacter populi]|uniref:Uncharacterized protein n=1 Tax=Paenirhodobacter populi TaxID=2306993 RepID=A0A443J877_9RHOB|nr:hypothetical protein [Sinirhodobacter populi]RWR16702.1 hypothetical protein D2T30_20915 [Sinirhodobacter populi]